MPNVIWRTVTCTELACECVTTRPTRRFTMGLFLPTSNHSKRYFSMIVSIKERGRNTLPYSNSVNCDLLALLQSQHCMLLNALLITANNRFQRPNLLSRYC